MAWPNARCGNNQQEYAENAMWCQRSSAALWFCANVSPVVHRRPSAF